MNSLYSEVSAKGDGPDLKHARIILFLAAFAALLVTAAMLPLEQLLMDLQAWAANRGALAFIAVLLVIALAFLVLLPSSLFMMLAGFLFGTVKGLAVVWLAGLVASTLAFRIGRTVARPWIERRMRRHTTFMAIDRAVERKGFLVVFLTRIVMLLPFPWLNYALGLTSVGTKDYVAGTNLGMILPYFLFVYLGTTVSNVTAIINGQVSLERNELIAGGVALAVVLLVVALIIRSSAKVLKAELSQSADAS
mgnify:CR=1 FL=1